MPKTLLFLFHLIHLIHILHLGVTYGFTPQNILAQYLNSYPNNNKKNKPKVFLADDLNQVFEYIQKILQ
jgi:hypothetical protein